MGSTTRRKRQIEGQKNTERIAPRFSHQEKALLKAAALKRRLTLSNFVGQVALDEAEKVLGMTVDEFERVHMSKRS